MNQMVKNFALFLLLWILFPLKSLAQDIRFKHLTNNNGLSQNLVLSIAQDSEGFMWFGTKDGLNKYDGYRFKVFQNEPNNPNSISSNYISSLFSDNNGKLWIGTENGIVNVYNATSQSFQKISLPLSQSKSKNSDGINTIAQDKTGDIWIGTIGSGIFRIPFLNHQQDPTKIKQYHNDSSGKYKLCSNIIKKIVVDDAGIIWIGTDKGLNRMDPQTTSISSFYFDIKHPNAPESDTDLSISAINKTDNNILWLGTRSGLVKFNTIDNSFKVFPHHLSVFRYGWGEINEITEDKQGDLWIATPGELMRFNTKTLKYTSIKNDPLKPESISYNSISSLLFDRTNILWIGTSGMGIDFYDPKANRFGLLKRKVTTNSRVTGFSIRAILEESDRYVWISAEVLYRWDRKTGELKSFETSSKNLNAFGNTSVWSMIKSTEGNLWFSSTEGLFVYNPKTETAKQLKYDRNNPNGLPLSNIISIFEDKNGIIWIVTENFLSKMTDRKKGIFKHFKLHNNPIRSTTKRCVIYEDGKNQLWLGTKNGLLVFDKNKEVFYGYQNNPEIANSLSNNQVNAIFPDPLKPEGLLWIGTSGGLNLFNINKQSFTHFTQKEGLPNNVIYGISSDSQDNLWLSTNRGISKYNIKTKKFRNYDVEDGLQSNEFNTGAVFKGSKGELFFGGINGLNYFFPDQINDNPFQPLMGITGLKVYSQSKKKNEIAEIKEIPINKNENITFTPRDEIIIFEFTALDFSSPGKNKYAYRLENFNENWIYLDNSRTATFTHLPSGNYVLKVKGSNNDEVWNEEGISISFKVLPHWSATWFAIAFYMLLFLLLFFFTRKYEMKRIKMKNELELEQKEYNTLKVLDQLKSRFFANISHEFRTPLTLISGYAENLMEALPTNHIKKQAEGIDQNAKTLLKLINELLDISKLEAGKMPLALSQQNIVLFLKNLFFSLESFAEKRHITLNFVSDETEIQIVFDEEKMEKIIMNIVANALKFTPENGEITLTIQQNNNQRLTICICDTGIGIDEEAISNIFDRFYQADNSDTRLYEGTGIGLALVKELVELHDGTVKAFRNEELTGEKGTTISIELPIGAVSEIINATQTKIDNQTQKSFELKYNKNNKLQIPEINFDKKIIVLVEDNLAIRTFIKNILQPTYKVIEASNGEEGFELAKKVIPDVIITDVMMPKLDGISMVHLLKNEEKTSHIPIVILTGKTALEDKLTGLETGIEAYLTKPFSVKELQLIINNLIQQREQLLKKYQNKLVVASDDIPLESVDHLFLEKAIQHIKDNIENTSFSVELLADKMCLSPSQLNRKLQALIDQAPGQLIRNIRLQRAADLIKKNAGTLADICFQTGFNDQTYFSRAFKNQFGCSPSAFKKDNASRL
jgi:signal transduction histidine kinase/ligand-binding sensor domain-containing protein/DNA-binding response OmpR family regulator